MLPVCKATPCGLSHMCVISGGGMCEIPFEQMSAEATSKYFCVCIDTYKCGGGRNCSCSLINCLSRRGIGRDFACNPRPFRVQRGEDDAVSLRLPVHVDNMTLRHLCLN